MKKTGLALFVVMAISSSAFAAVKTIICDDTLLKVGFSSDSNIFRAAESGTPDLEMMTSPDQIDDAGIVLYSEMRDKFVADTYMGEARIHFESFKDEKTGEITSMKWTNMNDGTTDMMTCYELKRK